MILRVMALGAFSLASSAGAGELRLSWPVACTLGETCHIQQYVDQDTGPGARDFTCGGLSYDGHKGTDIALPSLAALEEMVPVLAAAEGVVAGVRDGMLDAYATPERAEEIAGKECGNGVLLRHQDGWETQYCHLKQGSIRVKAGQTVTAGTELGAVGLSGKTQFPHLHLSVRHDGAVVDPFAPEPSQFGSCGPQSTHTLWQTLPAYEAGALISAGVSDQVPDYADVRAGTADLVPFSSSAPALVLWGYAFGGQAEDKVVLRITDPSQNVFFQSEQILEKAQAQFFRAGGKRLHTPLPVGTYQGTVELWRGADKVDSITHSFEVMPPSAD